MLWKPAVSPGGNRIQTLAPSDGLKQAGRSRHHVVTERSTGPDRQAAFLDEPALRACGEDEFVEVRAETLAHIRPMTALLKNPLMHQLSLGEFNDEGFKSLQGDVAGVIFEEPGNLLFFQGCPQSVGCGEVEHNESLLGDGLRRWRGEGISSML
jgi:hypothetical protein